MINDKGSSTRLFGLYHTRDEKITTVDTDLAGGLGGYSCFFSYIAHMKKSQLWMRTSRGVEEDIRPFFFVYCIRRLHVRTSSMVLAGKMTENYLFTGGSIVSTVA